LHSFDATAYIPYNISTTPPCFWNLLLKPYFNVAMGRHRRTARAIEWEAESSSLSLSPEGDGGDVSDVDAHNDVTQPEEVESVPDDVVNAQEQVDDVQEDLPHVEETVQEEPEFPLAPTPITVTSDLPGEESNSYNELDDLVDVPDYNNIEWLYQVSIPSLLQSSLPSC
jgi:hypothetical protein